MRATAFELLEAVNALANGANCDTFRDIFGDRVGTHLWGKYVAFEFDLLRLYGTLDTGNRKILAAFLNTFYQVNQR